MPGTQRSQGEQLARLWRCGMKFFGGKTQSCSLILFAAEKGLPGGFGFRGGAVERSAGVRQVLSHLSQDAHGSRISSFVMARAKDNLNIHFECCEKREEAIGGEAGEFSLHQLRNVGLFEPEFLSGLALSKTELFDLMINLPCELGFELKFAGLRKADIRKNVAAPFSYRDCTFSIYGFAFLLRCHSS